MRILVALGGNALLARGEAMTAQAQRVNVRRACEALAPAALEHELVISHGNGPQVGLLALQALAYTELDPYPLDILGAQTEGMIGYLIEQELGNLIPDEMPIATILTQTEVSLDDPAFADPTKFVGPVYDEATARALASERGWTVKPDGPWWRRVVPSPRPLRIFEARAIGYLLERGCVVVCTGGGGIPTAFEPGTRRLTGVEAVVDKDLASEVVARELDVDRFVIATDAPAVLLGWGTPEERPIARAHPDALATLEFAPGSMGPKVAAAVAFARATGRPAVIGALTDLAGLLAGAAGTTVTPDADGIELR